MGIKPRRWGGELSEKKKRRGPGGLGANELTGPRDGTTGQKEAKEREAEKRLSYWWLGQAHAAGRPAPPTLFSLTLSSSTPPGDLCGLTMLSLPIALLYSSAHITTAAEFLFF